MPVSGLKLTFSKGIDSLGIAGAARWKSHDQWGNLWLAGNAEDQINVDPSDPGLGIHSLESNTGALTDRSRSAASSEAALGGREHTSGLGASHGTHGFAPHHGHSEMHGKLLAEAGMWPGSWQRGDNGTWSPKYDGRDSPSHSSRHLAQTNPLKDDHNGVIAHTAEDLQNSANTHGIKDTLEDHVAGDLNPPAQSVKDGDGLQHEAEQIVVTPAHPVDLVKDILDLSADDTLQTLNPGVVVEPPKGLTPEGSLDTTISAPTDHSPGQPLELQDSDQLVLVDESHPATSGGIAPNPADTEIQAILPQPIGEAPPHVDDAAGGAVLDNAENSLPFYLTEGASIPKAPAEVDKNPAGTGNNTVVGTDNHLTNAIPVSGMQLTFAEEFDSLDLGAAGRWKPYDQWGNRWLAGNAEEQIYVDPSYQGLGINPFEINSGVLTIQSRPSGSFEAALGGRDYTSGMISSHGPDGFSQQYGYFEMRAQLPAGAGMWPGFWLLSDNGTWPPELDVMESIGQAPGYVVQSIHSKDGNSGVPTYTTDNLQTSFNTYGMNWTEDTITYYFNGKETGTFATPSDMHTKMHMLLNTAVGGIWPGSPDSTVNWADANFKIDYVRVYAAAPEVAAAPSEAGPVAASSLMASRALAPSDEAIPASSDPVKEAEVHGQSLNGGPAVEPVKEGTLNVAAPATTDDTPNQNIELRDLDQLIFADELHPTATDGMMLQIGDQIFASVDQKTADSTNVGSGDYGVVTFDDANSILLQGVSQSSSHAHASDGFMFL